MRKDWERAFNPKGADLIYKGQAILVQMKSKLSERACDFVMHAIRQIKNPFFGRFDPDKIPPTGLSVSCIADLSILDDEPRKMFIKRQKDILDELYNFSWCWYLNHSKKGPKVSGRLATVGCCQGNDEKVWSVQTAIERSVVEALVAALEYREKLEAMERENH